MLSHAHLHVLHIHPVLLVLVALFALTLIGLVTANESRGTTVVLVLVIIGLFLLLSGCTTLETGIQQPSEQAWQALHVVDTLQTERVTTDHCFRERETAFELGAHPNQAQVAAWAVSAAVFHDFVTGWLVEHDHPRLEAAWQFVSIADTGYDVVNNFRIGIRVGAPNVTPEGCT